MRIISKHRDYYDSCMRYGMDKTFVYARNREEIPVSEVDTKFDRLSQRPLFYSRNMPQGHPFSNVREGAVGFCGKIYPFVSSVIDFENEEFFYNAEAFERFYAHLKRHKSFEKDYSRYFKEVDKHFRQNPVVENESLFLEMNVPSLAIEGSLDYRGEHHLVKNPTLKDYKFYKVFDPFSAYQEISMFLGNQLCNTKEAEVPVGDDIVLAQSKGYNKWSFRKEPSK